MVLDESTSSLDASSEQAIMEFLFTFKGEKTLIIIAHRLTTVKNADRVVYLGNGKVQAEGTFASLKENLPEFHQQVLLQDFN
jgi:ABC-type multidrug transport system fused ATPase/permease subunit